jgi:two-component system, OmpR family, response regulator
MKSPDFCSPSRLQDRLSSHTKAVKLLMRILLIEDDPETASHIGNGLAKLGHLCEHVTDGREGLILATTDKHYDVVVIDRMLPGLDGLALVKMLRGAGVKTPALFLTALGGVPDRVAGLNAGGDDYLNKPFEFPELFARLTALTRRPALDPRDALLTVADLELDLVERRVMRGSKEIKLLPREFKLLRYLMQNAERVVTRIMVLENVWGFHFDPRSKIIETHISRLRAKIDKGAERQLIHTIRGYGYVIRAHS